MEFRKRYCIFGCDALVAHGVPLHRFPNPAKRPELFAAWVSAVGDKLRESDHKKIYNNKRVCDQHFEPSHKTSGGRLIWSAIPAVHLNCVQQSLITFVETDHSYCHARRESLLAGPVMTNLPVPSAVQSLPGPSTSRPSSADGTTISPVPPASNSTCSSPSVESQLRKSQMTFDEAPIHTSVMYNVDAVSKCRCCLQDGAAELSIFSAHGSAVLYAEMLRQCCSLEVFESDGKPSHICVECSSKLQASYYFKEMCLQTDKILTSEQHALASRNDTKSMKFERLGVNVVSEDSSSELLNEVHDSDVLEDARDQAEDAKMRGEVTIEFEGVNVDETSEGCPELECNDLETLANYMSKTIRIKERNATKCVVCNITFATTKEFRVHMDQHGSYKCECGATFVFKFDMYQHRKDTHNEPGFQCEHCSKSYSRKGRLELHVRKCHTRLKPYQCKTCKMTFNMREKLRNHKLKTGHAVRVTRESRNSVDKCELCGKRCHTRSKLREHIDWVHRGIKFYCHICQKNYTSKSRHMEMNHGNGKKCKICDTWLPTKMQYHVHINQKHREQMQRCNCGALISSSKKHDKHTCTNKTLVCQFCAKIFKNTSSFNIHLKRHTNEKPFQCDICTKMFSNKGDLGRHRQRHTNPKNIKCHFCPSMFRTRKDLSAHITMHDEGSKRYPCGVCGKKFRRSDHRNNHQRNVHRLDDAKLESGAHTMLNTFRS